MTLPAHAPSWISDAMTRLLESATLVAAPLSLTTASFCYPRAVDGTDVGNLIVLEGDSVSIDRHTNGGTFISGVIKGVLVMPCATAPDPGYAEALMVQAALDVAALQTDGLFVKRIQVGRCGVPGPGFFAGADAGQPETSPTHVTLPFSIEWGDG